MTWVVKNPLAVQGTLVWSLSREAYLEKGLVTPFRILTWRISWTEKPGRLYTPRGCKKSNRTEWLTLWLSTSLQGTIVSVQEKAQYPLMEISTYLELIVWQVHHLWAKFAFRSVIWRLYSKNIKCSGTKRFNWSFCNHGVLNASLLSLVFWHFFQSSGYVPPLILLIKVIKRLKCIFVLF